jgi:hypothetical protein
VITALDAETLTWAETVKVLRAWALEPDQAYRDLDSGVLPIVLWRTAAIIEWFDADDVLEKMQAIKQETLVNQTP